MTALAVGRPVFHSEADIQHAFAWELQRTHPAARIRLETRPARSGALDEALVDQAVLRVLTQKADLGLLDQTFDGEAVVPPPLDPPEHRAVAAKLAEESVVLLSNDGTLPLRSPARVAVIGPNADRATALFACYSLRQPRAGEPPGDCARHRGDRARGLAHGARHGSGHLRVRLRC